MRALAIVLVFTAAQVLAQETEQRGAADFETRAMTDIVDCMV
jgi:hypothetical protein